MDQSPLEQKNLPGLRSLGMLVLAGALAGSSMLGYAVHASMPFNPIRLPMENKAILSVLLPEGWRFFTRNPQEEQLYPYVRGGGQGWQAASRGPSASAKNLFGLNRFGRSQGLEIGIISSQIKEQVWRACAGDPEECLEKTPVFKQVRNMSPVPSLCGDVGLVLQRPVPWAWAGAARPVRMPSRVVRLEIQC